MGASMKNVFFFVVKRCTGTEIEAEMELGPAPGLEPGLKPGPGPGYGLGWYGQLRVGTDRLKVFSKYYSTILINYNF